MELCDLAVYSDRCGPRALTGQAACTLGGWSRGCGYSGGRWPHPRRGGCGGTTELTRGADAPDRVAGDKLGTARCSTAGACLACSRTVWRAASTRCRRGGVASSASLTCAAGRRLAAGARQCGCSPRPSSRSAIWAAVPRSRRAVSASAAREPAGRQPPRLRVCSRWASALGFQSTDVWARWVVRAAPSSVRRRAAVGRSARGLAEVQGKAV